MPDLEFLEFLGQFETDAGEWIDPDSLLNDELLLFSDAEEPDEESTDTNDATNTDQ